MSVNTPLGKASMCLKTAVANKWLNETSERITPLAGVSLVVVTKSNLTVVPNVRFLAVAMAVTLRKS